jgi:hypothetical protein
LAVNCAELLSIGIAASVTGSVALRAQTAANAAEVAVEVFLLIGVLSSVRPPDDTHPPGYGRERFFWPEVGIDAMEAQAHGAKRSRPAQHLGHPLSRKRGQERTILLALLVVLLLRANEVRPFGCGAVTVSDLLANTPTPERQSCHEV